LATLKPVRNRNIAHKISLFSFAIGLMLLTSCGGGHRPGIYHQVERGETLHKIARQYNVSVLEIARANNIKDLSSHLEEDTVLFIPGATQKKETKGKKTSSSPPPPPPPSRKETVEKKPLPPKEEPKPLPETTKGEKRLFVWPYRGEVTNNFGHQPGGMFFNHIRIDGKESDPVIAAADGTVIFSASLKDFGETVILKHDRGFTTIYTHLGSRLVRVEERVVQGKKIGTPRSTGKNGRAFIHFEIRENTKPLNPLQFLPPKGVNVQ